MRDGNLVLSLMWELDLSSFYVLLPFAHAVLRMLFF
jgi:hypothetical protein